MNKNKALEVMLTEKCCVERQDDISKCDRRCGECDLLLPTEEVLQAYDFVINMLTEKEEKRPHGEWILKEPDYDNDGGNNLYECNNCHHYDTHSGSIEVPYCWYCGADMREEAD